MLTVVWAAFAAPATSRGLSLRVADHVQEVACPDGAGAQAGELCFKLSGAATAVGFGAVTLGPLLESEAPQGDGRCHQTQTARRTATIAGAELDLSLSWPALCLGAVETVTGTYDVRGGTGVLSGATGTGTFAISARANGASEQLDGTVEAPALPPASTTKPTLRLVSATSSGRRLRIVFTAHGVGWPATLSYAVRVTGGGSTLARAGTVPRSGRETLVLTYRRQPHAPQRVTLDVTDVAGNSSTVTLRVR